MNTSEVHWACPQWIYVDSCQFFFMSTVLNSLEIYLTHSDYFVGIFPEPDKDPVIQIANMVIRQGERDPFIRNVFTLRSCAPVVGSQVISNEKESDLLKVTIKDYYIEWYCVQGYCKNILDFVYWVVVRKSQIMGSKSDDFSDLNLPFEWE